MEVLTGRLVEYPQVKRSLEGKVTELQVCVRLQLYGGALAELLAEAGPRDKIEIPMEEVYLRLGDGDEREITLTWEDECLIQTETRKGA